MNNIDDTMLIQYVDGELDFRTSAEIEAAIAEDAELRDRVQVLRESAAALSVAFNHVMYEPMPVLTAKRRRSWPGRWGALMAASLMALVLGTVAGHFVTLSTLMTELADVIEAGRIAQIARANADAENLAFMRALETKVSGSTVDWQNPDTGNGVRVTPVRTFRNQGGQYCREFQRVRFGSTGEARDQGIACRVGAGEWATRMQYFEG
jgi:surface antigen